MYLDCIALFRSDSKMIKFIPKTNIKINIYLNLNEL